MKVLVILILQNSLIFGLTLKDPLPKTAKIGSMVPIPEDINQPIDDDTFSKETEDLQSSIVDDASDIAENLENNEVLRRKRSYNSRWRSHERYSSDNDHEHRYNNHHNSYNDRHKSYNNRRNSYNSHRNSYEYNDNHNNRNDRSSNKRHRYRRLFRTEIELPSSNKVNITDPPYSKEWNCGSSTPVTNITLNPEGKMGSIEYNIVKNEVTGIPAASPVVNNIISVQKLNNQCLWKRYRYRKNQLQDTVGDQATKQKLLYFVGNAGALNDLASRGFDERELTLTSTAYGAGWMFSISPVQSNALASVGTSKILLLCRVTIGRSHDLASPQAFAHPPVGFESVHHGDYYIVYRAEQVYPEYLVTYT